jgi:predicted  nucleic acid-binding Zn-ribbon protein
MVALLAVSLLGCGKKADENKPMADVKAEAEKMDESQLRATARVYYDAIKAKMADLEKTMDKLKDIPPLEAVGEEAKGLQADIDALNKSISNLKVRFQVYYDKLVEKGGDTSGLQL